MHIKTVVFIMVPLLLSYGSCKKPVDTTPPMDQDLIFNSSFESASGPSIDGWTSRNRTIYAFVPDAPEGGGRYSIKLRPVWDEPFSFNSVTTRLALPIGTHRYRISCWAKKLPRGAGFLALFVGRGNVDTLTAAMRIPIADTVSTFYSRDTVITNQVNDSVVVALHGGYSPIVLLADATFFDLCKFERLD